MSIESTDAIFIREMKRIRLAAKYPINQKNKLPLKPMVDMAYHGKKTPISVDVRVKLRDAAMSKKVVKIVYKKTTNQEIKTYMLEPYSYRYLRLKIGVRKMLFGWDIKEKKIKSFAMRNISKIEITGGSFAPRYPIEIAKKIRKKDVRKAKK